MPVEKSAGAIIFRKEGGKNHFLLLHYLAGHWDFPKGHIEKGEKINETIRREVKEETGIEKIRFVSGFKQDVKYFFKAKEENIFKIVVFLLAETDVKEIKISKEHKGFKWLTFQDALNQLTFNNAKKILKKANDFLSKNE